MSPKHTLNRGLVVWLKSLVALNKVIPTQQIFDVVFNNPRQVPSIFYKIKKRQPSFVSYSHYSLGMYPPRQWYLIVCCLGMRIFDKKLSFKICSVHGDSLRWFFMRSSWCFLLFIYLLTMSQVALSSASKFQCEHNRPSSHKSCVRSLNPYWFLKLDLRCVVEIILSRAQLMHVLIAYFNRFFFFQ